MQTAHTVPFRVACEIRDAEGAGALDIHLRVDGCTCCVATTIPDFVWSARTHRDTLRCVDFLAIITSTLLSRLYTVHVHGAQDTTRTIDTEDMPMAESIAGASAIAASLYLAAQRDARRRASALAQYLGNLPSVQLTLGSTGT